MATKAVRRIPSATMALSLDSAGFTARPTAWRASTAAPGACLDGDTSFCGRASPELRGPSSISSRDGEGDPVRYGGPARAGRQLPLREIVSVSSQTGAPERPADRPGVAHHGRDQPAVPGAPV